MQCDDYDYSQWGARYWRFIRHLRGECSRFFSHPKVNMFLWLNLLLWSGIGLGYLLQPAPVYVYDGIKAELYVEGPQYTLVIEQWKREVARRFPTALVVVCHGNQGKEIVKNAEDWYMYPETPGCIPVRVRDKALELKRLYPNRPIVFLTCNPSGVRLNIPGVWHALNNVWLTPDKNVEDTSGIRAEPQIVGSIYEFVSIEAT